MSETNFCICPTDRRPKVDADGKCLKCGLTRTPKFNFKKYRKPRKTREERISDHVDGYDRDDIGLSPDF